MHRRHFSRRLAPLSLAALFVTPAAAQTFAEIGIPNNTNIWGLSADGRAAVGEHDFGNWHAARWTAAGGVEDLGTLGGNESVAYGTNRDGSVVVGWARRSDGFDHAFRWTAAGMQDLGVLSGGNGSEACAVSADGGVVVGWSEVGGGARAFRWTETTGMQSLGVLGTGNSSHAYAVSADGSVVAGRSNETLGGFYRAFRWTQAGGMQSLGLLSGGTYSEAYGISADGSVIVGTANVTGGSSRAFRWTEASGMADLGHLGGGWSRGKAVSADGKVVVGASHDGSDLVAFRWTQATGMQSVKAWLAGAGVVVPASWVLQEATGVDAGGNVVVGYGYDDGALMHSWLARVGPAGAGLIADVAAFNASLLQSARRAARAGMDLANLPLFGAHHRTLLDNGLARTAGGACAWATADAADYRASDTRMELAEVGACKDIGAWRLGAGLGVQTARQDWQLGGGARIDGQYLVLEATRAFDGGWEGSALVWHGRFDARLDRRYMNGASLDASRGTPDLRGTALRLRADWKEAARLGAFALGPYASYTHAESRLDAYTETGGGFPAAYGAVRSRSDDLRLGLAAHGALSGATALRLALEANHRIDDSAGDGRAQAVDLLGLWRFELPGEKTKRDWLRATADIDHRLSGGSVLSFGAGAATTGGGDPDWNLTVGWRIAF